LAPSEDQPRVRGWVLAAKDNKIGYRIIACVLISISTTDCRLVPANYVEVLGRSNATTVNNRRTLNNVLEVDQTD